MRSLIKISVVSWVLLLLFCPKLYCDSTVVKLLSDYVKIPSISGEENEAAYFIAKKCREVGLIVEYINDSPGSVNFVASLYPLSWNKPNIVFHSHIDVVPPGDSLKWKTPPFGGVIEGGKVWGRGAMDCKGLGVAHLAVASNFVQRGYNDELSHNISLLFVSGEETGGSTGSKIVAQNFIEKFNPVVVLGEGGAGMNDLSFITKENPLFGISIAEKENIWLKLSWSTNMPGHASIANYDYANMLMIKGLHKLLHAKSPIIITPEAALMFESLGKALGGVKGSMLKKPNSKLFKKAISLLSKGNEEIKDIVSNKITISQIGGESGAINQIASTESAILDVRLLPGTTPEEIVSYIKSVINDGVVSIEVICGGQSAPSTTPEKFFELLSEAIKSEYPNANVVPMLFPASADNNYFRAHGIPVYGINPMMVSRKQLNAIHNYNEYIDIKDVEDAIAIFTHFINSIVL